MYVHIYCVGIGTRLRKYRESPILELSCQQQHLSASQNAKVKQLQHGNMIMEYIGWLKVTMSNYLLPLHVFILIAFNAALLL